MLCCLRAEGNKVPCINNTQTWGGYWYPGLIVTHPTGTEDYSIRGKFRGARARSICPMHAVCCPFYKVHNQSLRGRKVHRKGTGAAGSS